jgi:VWFA-related protein
MTTRPPRPHGIAPRAPGALLAVAVAFAMGVAALWPGVLVFAQTFRSSVDLIAVDVQVVGRKGEPMLALGPEHFEVTLDGRKRRVVSVSFARYDIAPPSDIPRLIEATSPGQSPPPAAAATASSPAPGRTFIIAIDTASFRTLDAHVAIIAAQRFTRQLLPDDAVGIFTLPFGLRLTPTTSHATVAQAIGTVVGRKPIVPGQFEMSVEQIIDITATAANQSLTASRRTVGQMFTENTASADAMDCSGSTISCTEVALAEAQSLATALEEEVLQGLSGLDSLLRLLQSFPGRKTVLLLSGGMPVSDRGGGRPNVADELKRLGEQATYANATIHALYFDPNLNTSFSVESRRARTSSGRMRVIYTRALAEFSEPSGGTLIEVSTGAGEAEIDRLLAQTSSYYVLGVEPEDRDRDGRPHRLKVTVNQRDVTVRSRQLVVVPRRTS